MICTWPNGETKEVEVLSDNGSMARVIWNELVETSCATVTGFEEEVPISWLTNE